MRQSLLDWEGAPVSFEAALTKLLGEAERLVGSFRSYEQAVVEVHMTAAPGGDKNELLKAAYAVLRDYLGSVDRLCRQARELEPNGSPAGPGERIDREMAPGGFIRQVIEEEAARAPAAPILEEQPDAHLGAVEEASPAQGEQLLAEQAGVAVPWPQPNEDGVYGEERAELLETVAGKASAKILLLQVEEQEWVYGWSSSHRLASHSHPVKRDDICWSRDQALYAAVEQLTAWWGGWSEQIRETRKIQRWAGGLLACRAVQEPDAALAEAGA
jgi:hypothetical protein